MEVSSEATVSSSMPFKNSVVLSRSVSSSKLPANGSSNILAPIKSCGSSTNPSLRSGMSTSSLIKLSMRGVVISWVFSEIILLPSEILWLIISFSWFAESMRAFWPAISRDSACQLSLSIFLRFRTVSICIIRLWLN